MGVVGLSNGRFLIHCEGLTLLYPHTKSTQTLLLFPSAFFLCLLYSIFFSPHVCPFLCSCPFLPPHRFSSLNICICLVWDWRCFMCTALTYARLPGKPRQPCSTGRCLRTCAAPRHTAKTQLRQLQLVLSRPPLRVWPLASLCSLALEGRQVPRSCQLEAENPSAPQNPKLGRPGSVRDRLEKSLGEAGA